MPGQASLQIWLLRAALAAALAAGWELLAILSGSLMMPRFTATVPALVNLLKDAALWRALWISNQAMLLGFALAALTGVTLGLAMARWRAAGALFGPWLNILIVTPMAAAIPIVIMAAGLGLFARAIVVFLFALPTIAIATSAGLATVDASWVEMSRAFGATGWQLWRKVLLRAARPAILTGLRLGLIRAVSGMITMEILLIAVGVGRLIVDYQSAFEPASMYATVLVVMAEAVILTQLCQRLEHRASPWTAVTAE